MPSPTICDPSNSSVDYTNTKHYCLSINSIKSRHSCGRAWLSEAKPNVMHKHHLVCGHNHVIRPSTASLPPLPRHTRERHVIAADDTSHPRTTRHPRGRGHPEKIKHAISATAYDSNYQTQGFVPVGSPRSDLNNFAQLWPRQLPLRRCLVKPDLVENTARILRRLQIVDPRMVTILVR